MLGQRVVRPSLKRQSRLAGLPCGLVTAAAAFDALSPRAAPSARRRQTLATHPCSPFGNHGLLVDRLGHLSSGVTYPVTLRSSGAHKRPANDPHDDDVSALERLKEIERLDAYANALAHAICNEAGFPMNASAGPFAVMDIIETYVDAVRKAKGKPTYADLNPDDANFEAQLDDFVADIFRAMGAAPRG